MGLYQLVMPVYSMLMSLTAVGLTVAVSTLSARHHALGDNGTVRLVLRRALMKGGLSDMLYWPEARVREPVTQSR